MILKREQMAAISRLLDEALALDEAGRRQWLQNLPSEHQELAESLRAALLPEAASRDSLSTLPKIITDQDPQSAAGGLREGTRVGPYRVLSLLGLGGMGSVWLAERADGLFTRRAALKLIHPALKSRVMSERFSREREILASLNHPNIARLLDAGYTEDNQSYLALEYIAGKTLTTYCDEQRLGVRQRLELFRQVLSAVQYAHAHLVIHRDLKPSNILVTAEGQVQLLDFGIAKLLTEGEAKETELTQLGGRALTPDYAAPEQIVGAPITIAADVYALGVMLYELLTGARPYRLKRDSRGALEEAILETEIALPSRSILSESVAQDRSTSIRKLSAELRGDLDTIIAKTLQKSPAGRYPTANALGEDVERFLRDEPVLAQRDKLGYRAIKFARRHWAGISIAALMISVLAAGLVGTTYEAQIARRQRDAAFQAQLRSLTQTAAARLIDNDVSSALGIILEVLPHAGASREYTPEALNVLQEARATDLQLLAITGHDDRIRTAAFSPDGQRVVTASYDRTARIWDARTGRQLRVLSGHTNAVTSAAFSADGRRVLTASADRSMRVWDADTGREILLLKDLAGQARWASFSPDGRRILAAPGDKTARIWDAATGEEKVVFSGHADWVTSSAFSPDGQRVITGSLDKSARIWDAATGRQILLLENHTETVASVAFSLDGRRVVTGSSDKTARIWDSATGREQTVLSGHPQNIYWVAFSPDGRRILTSSGDVVYVWDAIAGRQIMTLKGHTAGVISVAFSPDGNRIITASDDRTARIWDVSPGELLSIRGHTQVVSGAAYSPDGRLIVTASDDKTARVWDAANGDPLMVLRGHIDRINSAFFSPDGQSILTSSDDDTSRIWEVATGKELQVFRGHRNPVNSAKFSTDGRRIITASSDNTAGIWDVRTGQEVLVLKGHSAQLNSAEFSPDEHRVVTASLDKTARIWDAATGRQLTTINGGDRLECAAYSPDGGSVVVTSADHTARVFDAATGALTQVLSGHRERVVSAAFSPDGQRIVTSSDDKTVRIWDATTARQLKLLTGHQDLVETVAFSPDGRYIVSSSDDRTARIWDARAPDIQIQLLFTAAAQFDDLSASKRFQLGVPAWTDTRRWRTDRSKCDEAAAAPYDPDRLAPGLFSEEMVAEIATDACSIADRHGSPALFIYQQGRGLLAAGDLPGAKAQLEQALAAGHRAAAIDLGRLVAKSNASRAVSILEQAWRDGVSMAGFELGALYENEPRKATDPSPSPLDSSRAWDWYERAAKAHVPNALARIARREEDAAAVSGQATEQRDLHELTAFRYYTAAAEVARVEDWPEESWRNWRYRRASLARLLARQGKMPQVAEAYGKVRQAYSGGMLNASVAE